MSLAICNCVLRIKTEMGTGYASAELLAETRRSQISVSDSLYINKIQRSAAAPGIIIQSLLYISTSTAPLLPITVAYTGGGVAGSEVVSVVGSAISVQIQSGVSTASQVKTAIQASVAASALVACILSGTGSTAQTTVSATTLTDFYCYLPLSETTTNSQQMIFTLNWGDGNSSYNSIIFDPALIPIAAYQDLSSLLTVSRG